MQLSGNAQPVLLFSQRILNNPNCRLAPGGFRSLESFLGKQFMRRSAKQVSLFPKN
jgi:hypothetical protein